MHELPCTTPEILDMFILSFVLVLTKTHATTLDLFLTFLAQRKSSCQDSSHLVFLIKFNFYLFTTPQNQNQTTFFFSPPSLCWSFSFLFITPHPCLHFLLISSLYVPKFPLPILSKNLIHRSLEMFSLGCKDWISS